MAHHDPLTASLHAAVAEEMRHVRDLLEQLAGILVCDEHFATHYLEQLQSFDLLIQCADETAAVLDRLSGGAHSHEAIAPVRLTVMQNRLRAGLDGAVAVAGAA